MNEQHGSIAVFLFGFLTITLFIFLSFARADDLTDKLRSQIERRLNTNPAMISSQELYKLSEANLLLKLSEKVEKGEIDQKAFDLAAQYLQLWSRSR